MLALEDLKGMDDAAVKRHLVAEYAGEPPDGAYSDGRQTPQAMERARQWLSTAQVLVAYESVGAYGCDSSGYFLFFRDGKYYEIHAGHCSCFGFAGQFQPRETSLAYLSSDKFNVGVGGYDTSSGENEDAIRAFVRTLSQWLVAREV